MGNFQNFVLINYVKGKILGVASAKSNKPYLATWLPKKPLSVHNLHLTHFFFMYVQIFSGNYKLTLKQIQHLKTQGQRKWSPQSVNENLILSFPIFFPDFYNLPGFLPGWLNVRWRCRTRVPWAGSLYWACHVHGIRRVSHFQWVLSWNLVSDIYRNTVF